jgi:hypothetical protein
LLPSRDLFVSDVGPPGAWKVFFVLLLRDETLLKGVAPRFNLVAFLAAYWVNPVKFHNFGRAWLMRFLAYLSYITAIGYLYSFLQDVVHSHKGLKA